MQKIHTDSVSQSCFLFHVAGRQQVHMRALCSPFSSHTHGCAVPMQPWGRVCTHLQGGQLLPHSQHGQSPARPQKCFSDMHRMNYHSSAACLNCDSSLVEQHESCCPKVLWTSLSLCVIPLIQFVLPFCVAFSFFLNMILFFCMESNALMKYGWTFFH